jgi:ribose/xylose/arabinose/galactoside ABC-type transport system permease subunit
MKIPEDVFRRISAFTVLSLLLLLIMLFIAFMEPRIIKPSNLINLVRQSSIIGLVAFGMTCVILDSGIDLSVGSVLILSALVGASAVKAGGRIHWYRYPGYVSQGAVSL